MPKISSVPFLGATLMSGSCASALDMAAGCGRSAFFIDTAARSDKRPYFSNNSITASLKAALLLASLAIVHRILYSKPTTATSRKPSSSSSSSSHSSPSSATKDMWSRQAWRRHLVMGCCTAFVARVLLQMLLFWHRRITWVEVVVEAGVVVPMSLLSVRMCVCI